MTFAEVSRAMARGPITWSARVERIDAASPATLLAVNDERVLPTASIGKILLLLTVANDIEQGRLDPDRPLTIYPDDLVADSGLLQHLSSQNLPAVDHAVLVGAVSDNLATNVLLREVGLPRVHELTAQLGFAHVVLHDHVRDARTDDDPPFLSTAHAGDLVRLLTGLHEGSLLTPAVCHRVIDWLRFDTDTSMVAGAFGLDPLCHWDPDRTISLWHKTGTNVGTRADCGVVATPGATVAYACIAHWTPQGEDDLLRERVLAQMTHVGRAIRAQLE